MVFGIMSEIDFDLLHGRTCSLTQPANDIIVWCLSSISGDCEESPPGSPRVCSVNIQQGSLHVFTVCHIVGGRAGRGREGLLLSSGDCHTRASQRLQHTRNCYFSILSLPHTQARGSTALTSPIY